MLFSEKPFFFHTYKTVITDNDMIEKADAKQKAKAAEGPVVIACEIDREDMVYPMVPSNQSIDEIILQGGR